MRAMEGVSTSTAGFIGLAQRGPVVGKPQLVTSFADYKRMYKVQEVKPRTIAQQMKEAAKLAEADRGRAAPKKTTPDRGDR